MTEFFEINIETVMDFVLLVMIATFIAQRKFWMLMRRNIQTKSAENERKYVILGLFSVVLSLALLAAIYSVFSNFVTLAHQLVLFAGFLYMIVLSDPLRK